MVLHRHICPGSRTTRIHRQNRWPTTDHLFCPKFPADIKRGQFLKPLPGRVKLPTTLIPARQLLETISGIVLVTARFNRGSAPISSINNLRSKPNTSTLPSAQAPNNFPDSAARGSPSSPRNTPLTTPTLACLPQLPKHRTTRLKDTLVRLDPRFQLLFNIAEAMTTLLLRPAPAADPCSKFLAKLCRPANKEGRQTLKRECNHP